MNAGNIGTVVAGLSMRQRVVAGVALLAALGAFVGMLRLATAPSMALLYSGLDASAAGEVVQSLEQQGAAFEVRGGAIYVEASLRDSLRMTLAAEGKPRGGPAGYEILDSLSGFGTTSQMFDAAYWRAKEGELARTIMSSPGIASARVHISAPGARPFARAAAPGASISLLPAGAGIPGEQAAAVRFLVASAVPGLSPEDVTVIDARAGRVVAGEESGAPQAADLRAEDLRRRAERLLEARVGPGNAVVEVTVEAVTDSEQIVERRLDPESRVLISTEVEERATASTDTRPGDVTVASNLPDGDAAGSGAQSSSDDTSTRERSNFEVSETTRELVRNPGGIQRITVAVLVNETAAAADAAEDGSRSEEELAALRDLVASAVGLNEARGDVITVRAMPFTAAEAGGGVAPGLMAVLLSGLDVMRLVQLAVLAAVALVLGLFVVRPILTRAPATAPEVRRLPSAPVDTLDMTARVGPPGPAALPMPAVMPPPGAPDATQRLVRAVGGRQTETVSLLRGWMRAGETGA